MPQTSAIRYEYTTDTLADVPPSEFEARLYDALKSRWPGAIINIAQGGERRWGEVGDQEITPDELTAIGNEVFASIQEG